MKTNEELTLEVNTIYLYLSSDGKTRVSICRTADNKKCFSICTIITDEMIKQGRNDEIKRQKKTVIDACMSSLRVYNIFGIDPSEQDMSFAGLKELGLERERMNALPNEYPVVEIIDDEIIKQLI